MIVDQEPRCKKCHKKLAEWLSRPWRIGCIRCGFVNEEGPPCIPIDTPPTSVLAIK